VETKICSKCKEEKEICEFNKDKTRKDGFENKCKECKKKYYEVNLLLNYFKSIHYELSRQINRKRRRG